MSREEGPERTQRTVAELLAKYGDGSQESTPRRRRRRAEDAEETAPQAIIDRVNSTNSRLRPVGDEQPPDEDPPGPAAPPTTRHRPVPQPSQQMPQPQPAQQLPPPAPAPQVVQPTQRQMPPVPPPDRRERRPLPQNSQPLPQPSQQMPQPSQQLPKPVPRPPQPPQPSQQMPQPTGGWPAPEPGGLAARLDGRQDSRPDLRAAAPPQPMQDGLTEQIPRVTDEQSAPGMRTGQHPAPHRVARTSRAPQPAFPQPEFPAHEFPQHEPDESDNYPTEYHGFDPVPADPQQRTQFVEGIELDDDQYGQDYQQDPRSVEHDRPIGLDDDYVDEEDDEAEGARSPAREWLAMGGQLAIGVIGGAALWLGFNWLWGKFAIVALVIALVVTAGMVLVVRKIRHQEDLVTTIGTMVVSLVITVSPVLLNH
ncbi:NfeD family protein [Actinocrispum wychmicini]|uniref:Uncharacterized protein n=1 Tax=Actinocrispum wychmicini TaxID=1213861 RepID=A0A4V2S8U4_9PSEU|nr:hypothetical protein [Actinocrispum wychmicini]TCO65210.1 hypothetical protein EV192_101998 [Actinocrispum wychmicini]